MHKQLALVAGIIALLLAGAVGYALGTGSFRDRVPATETQQLGSQLPSEEESRNAPAGNDHAGTAAKTFSLNGIAFQYPASWTAEYITYATPGQADRGELGNVIGFKVINPSTGAEIGATNSRQGTGSTCATMRSLQPAILLCADVYDPLASADQLRTMPLISRSNDAATVAAFNQIVATYRHP